MDAGSNPVFSVKKFKIKSFMYNLSYTILFIYFIIGTVLASVISIASYLLTIQSYDSEKLSAYECGFQPFEDTRNKFDIKFYLVSILFIIFDLEIAFLFPWATYLNYLSLEIFWLMFIFLVILTIGFTYEWIKGALNWD